eukprot:3874151-Prorocentrum_lima.AAC.1
MCIRDRQAGLGSVCGGGGGGGTNVIKHKATVPIGVTELGNTKRLYVGEPRHSSTSWPTHDRRQEWDHRYPCW